MARVAMVKAKLRLKEYEASQDRKRVAAMRREQKAEHKAARMAQRLAKKAGDCQGVKCGRQLTLKLETAVGLVQRLRSQMLQNMITPPGGLSQKVYDSVTEENMDLARQADEFIAAMEEN